MALLVRSKNVCITQLPFREHGYGMQKEKRVWAVKLDERGRTTIPKALLDVLGIKPGEIMAFVREDEGPVYVGKAELQVKVPFTKKTGRERIEVKKT